MRFINIKYFAFLFLCLPLMAFGKVSDIYLVIYTTKPGYTGHVGIAVDNYKIIVRDTTINKAVISRYDTVKNKSLTYYDFWGPTNINWNEHDMDLPGRYYKLPRTSAEDRITPARFLTKGLPHAYDYPCDALIRIATTPSMDYRLIQIAEELRTEQPFFNTRKYNCTDYVLRCVNRLLDDHIEAKEYIPFFWSSTPNKFYKAITSNLTVEIIKAAGDEINNSFFKERIINSVLLNHLNHEKTN
jgi:hypothetical protein